MHANAGRRLVAAVGFLAVCASTLMACSNTMDARSDEQPQSPPATAPPKPGGHLVYGLESDPNGLDPTRNAWDNSGIELANALYDPLVAIDAQGRPQPYLAESFTSSPDFLSWVFKLRPGVVFSNGDPLDATALLGFVDGLRKSAITGPGTAPISDVRALDDLSIKISLKSPWATLPVLLSGQGGYVVSPKQIADVDGTSHPIGTGPFILRNWEINKKFELVKNQRYWRTGLPYLDAVDFVVEDQGRKRIERLQTGDMDATALSSLWELQTLDEVVARNTDSPQIAVEKDTGDAEKNAILFNTLKPPLNDVRVRQAIAYATDIPTIARDNGWPLDRLAQGPIEQASPYFSPANYPTYDLEKAKALLREYLNDSRVRNRPREVTFTITSPVAANEGPGFVAQLVDQWAKAGIKAKVNYVDLKQSVRLAVLGEFETIVFRYFAAPDPDVFWHFFVSDTVADTGLSLNFARLRNPDITAGMNEGRSTTDVDARKKAYAKVQKGLAEQLPYLWMQRSEWRVASTPRVRAAHNVTLPDGSPAAPFLAGTYRLTETWLDR
jgi:peptide/nickel transport system substrate-binding protein